MRWVCVTARLLLGRADRGMGVTRELLRYRTMRRLGKRRGPRLQCPGPPRWLLLELELHRVVGAVSQLQVQFPASSGPSFIRLPPVDVMAGRRVVLEPAVGDGHRLFYRVNRQPRVAVDLLGGRVASSKDA